MNSAWRAYGGERDYGKLLIGERTIDNCVEDLTPCEFRIGIVHHPFSALTSFERFKLKSLVARRFHLWLRGHTHQNEAEFTTNLRKENTVIVKGGTLYQSRRYHNGYAVIDCDLSKAELNIYLREYQDHARKFIISSYLDRDCINYPLSLTSLQPLHKNTALVNSIRQSIGSAHRQVILPPVESLHDDITLAKAFVEPPLARKSEYATILLKDPNKTGDEEDLRLNKLLESGENLLFLGKKESGKTTLLNYISHLFAHERIKSSQCIPLLINHQQLPKGKNKIHKALKSYLIDLNVKAELKSYLRKGKCIVLVDDLDLTKRKSIDALREFITEYPKNQFIITANEDTFLELHVDREIDLAAEFERIYIHSFGRKQVRELGKKLLPNEQIDLSETADAILSHLHDINLPCSPTIVSLMFVITQNQPDYKPLNKASLMEGFIDILLEKNPFIAGWNRIDPKIKEDFLAEFSYQIINNEHKKMEIDEATSFVLRYFNGAGLDVPLQPNRFLQYFIDRNILIQEGIEIRFRFSCFREYFTAKKLLDDMTQEGEFYDEVLSQHRYLLFASEIDYLTGLHRKDRHIVKVIGHRTQKALDDLIDFIGSEIHLEDLDGLSISHGLTAIEVQENRQEILIDRIRESRLSEEQKDLISNLTERLQITNKSIELDTEPDPYDIFLSKLSLNLDLYAIVIRNTELIRDREFKREHLRTCSEIAMQLLYAVLLNNIESIEDMDRDEILEKSSLDLNPSEADSVDIEELRKHFADFSNVIMFLIFQQLLLT